MLRCVSSLPRVTRAISPNHQTVLFMRTIIHGVFNVMHHDLLQCYPPGHKQPSTHSTSYNHTYVGWHYLSKATCLIQPHLFCAFVGYVKDHHNLDNYSPRLKKPCVRQVVLDKCFPPNSLSTTVRRSSSTQKFRIKGAGDRRSTAHVTGEGLLVVSA